MKLKTSSFKNTGFGVRNLDQISALALIIKHQIYDLNYLSFSFFIWKVKIKKSYLQRVLKTK